MCFKYLTGCLDLQEHTLLTSLKVFFLLFSLFAFPIEFQETEYKGNFVVICKTKLFFSLPPLPQSLSNVYKPRTCDLALNSAHSLGQIKKTLDLAFRLAS